MEREMDIRIVNESGKSHETLIYGHDGQPLQYVTRFAVTGDYRNGVQAELWVSHPRHDIRVPDATVHIANARIAELEAEVTRLREILVSEGYRID